MFLAIYYFSFDSNGYKKCCALDEREWWCSMLYLLYLQKNKEAANAIYVVCFQFQWEIFFANLMFYFLYTSLLRIFPWSLGVHCMKGMIFKVGHSLNIDKHRLVICGVFSSKNVLSLVTFLHLCPLYNFTVGGKKGSCKGFILL